MPETTTPEPDITPLSDGLLDPHRDQILTWFHVDVDNPLWLGKIRAVVETRLPRSIRLQIATTTLEKLPGDLRLQQTPWSVISWSLPDEPSLLPAGWIAELRTRQTSAIRIAFGKPMGLRAIPAILELGAQIHIADTLELCHSVPWLLSKATMHPPTVTIPPLGSNLKP